VQVETLKRAGLLRAGRQLHVQCAARPGVSADPLPLERRKQLFRNLVELQGRRKNQAK
jgi:hypothetical protein